MNSQKLKDGATLTRPRPVFSPGRLVSAVVVLILAAMLVHGLGKGWVMKSFVGIR